MSICSGRDKDSLNFFVRSSTLFIFRAVPIDYFPSWLLVEYPISNNKCSAGMGDRLATIDVGRKLGGLLYPLFGELDPRPTQCSLGRGLHPCQVSSWSIEPFGHNTPTLQTGRQTDRQRFRRIAQTVLQMVVQWSKTEMDMCSWPCATNVLQRFYWKILKC